MSYICPVCNEFVKEGERHYHPIGWQCVCGYINGPYETRCVSCNRRKQKDSPRLKVPWAEVK